LASGVPLSKQRINSMELNHLFSDSSIHRKLAVLIIVSCSVALVLAGAGFISYEAVQSRKTAVRELTTLAQLSAADSTGALSFGDDRAARENLMALQADPRAIQGAIYSDENRLFAVYQNPGIPSLAPPVLPLHDGVHFENGTLTLFYPVEMHRQRIGTIMLKFSMKSTYDRLWGSAGVIGLLMIGALALALLIAARFQRAITGPIARLSNVVRRVSIDKNYSVRAQKSGNDETGLLIDSFNEMLAQIELHEQARQEAETALRDSEERYALAAQGANDGLWDWKIQSGKAYFSPRWKQMLGYSDAELRADPEEWFSRVHAADRDRFDAEIVRRGHSAAPVFACEYRIRQKSGLYIWTLCRGISVRDKNGNVIRMAGSQTDITEGKVVDPLTGLRNRLYFLDKLDACIQSAVGGECNFAVLFLDLDRFKVVNDSLGHDAGDRLLIEVASRLQSCLRSADIVTRASAQSVIARFGGDEFAVLLHDVRRPHDATVVAQRILNQLEAPFYLENHPVFVSFSIGIAPGGSGKTPEELLRNADSAMYYAKTRGKARFEVFDEGIRDRALARMELETDLRKAVNEHQFVVYYQPEVSLRTGKTVGFEALVRWEHPERGFLPPSEFIQAAEETGLIVPLGRWVLREACRQMAAWHREMPALLAPSVSVNMSLKQLADAAFVDDVTAALKESGLNPASLRLELTESSIMENSELTIKVLKRLKGLGVGLELDDFGTGYSSLSYLHQLPFDAVKIDRSFVSGMPGREGSTHLVETILGMARSLKLEVVAEGVETVEQRDQLRALGCPLAQGYLFSKPASGRATATLLREQLERSRQNAREEGILVGVL
jgi:diguanylate cyclase (GGDEF)-like protein/PAS domain S-box-containing protein